MTIRTEAVIALDVGGTSVKSAIVTRAGTALPTVDATRTTSIDSQAAAGVIVEQLAAIIAAHRQELGDTHLAGIAFGFPGPFDYAMGISRIQGVVKFETIYGLNVGRALQGQPGLADVPVRFRNDAEAAIVGEARYGAGAAYRRVIGVTLGTGCGSAFLIDGAPATDGPGVPPDGWLYPFPVQGRQADDVFSIRGLMGALASAGVASPDVRSAAILARQGDAEAAAVFARFGQELGGFLQPWVADFRADAVLLQGGIANAFDLFGITAAAGISAPLLPGILGENAALLGAAELFDGPAGFTEEQPT